jgi:hypothetical protein
VSAGVGARAGGGGGGGAGQAGAAGGGDPRGVAGGRAGGGVQVRPLGITIVVCVATAVLTVFTGPGDPGGFTEGLVLPRMWLPPLLLLFLHSVYLVVFGFLLYRAMVLPGGAGARAAAEVPSGVEARRGRLSPRTLGVVGVGGALAFMAFWNPLLAGIVTAGAGSGAGAGAGAAGAAAAGLGIAAVGSALFAVWLTGVAVFLLRRDRVAGLATLPYLGLAFHDFWWAWMLVQLN